MATSRISWMLLLVALLQASLLLPCQVLCLNDKESKLLVDINAFRTSKKLPTFQESSRASCLASHIADKYNYTFKCLPITSNSPVPINEADTICRGFDFDSILRSCSLDPKGSRDGIILPACVPGLERDSLGANYTKTIYANYIGNRKYLRVGIGSDGDWMVVLLTEDKKKSAAPKLGSGNYWFVGILCFVSFLFVLI